MTREEKVAYKQQRAKLRREKRNEAYFSRIRQAREISHYVPLRCVTRWGTTGAWEDPSSPTGYSQVCDWSGICQHPCNGDC